MATEIDSARERALDLAWRCRAAIGEETATTLARAEMFYDFICDRRQKEAQGSAEVQSEPRGS
jgi:hypothetical protein